MVSEGSSTDGVDPDASDRSATDQSATYESATDAGSSQPPDDPGVTWPRPAKFSAAAAFEDPYRTKPSRYHPAYGEIPPSVPLDPILPYVAPPVPRRRRSDWPVLVVAMIISALVMAGCCIAGFALYTGYGGALFN